MIYTYIILYTYFELQSLCVLHGQYQRETKHPVKTHNEGWIEGVKICQLRCEIGGEEILKAMDVADRNLFKKLLGRSSQEKICRAFGMMDWIYICPLVRKMCRVFSGNLPWLIQR